MDTAQSSHLVIQFFLQNFSILLKYWSSFFILLKYYFFYHFLITHNFLISLCLNQKPANSLQNAIKRNPHKSLQPKDSKNHIAIGRKETTLIASK